MNYRLLPEAQGELDSAAAYYESNRDGLGSEFLAAIGAIVFIDGATSTIGRSNTFEK